MKTYIKQNSQKPSIIIDAELKEVKLGITPEQRYRSSECYAEALVKVGDAEHTVSLYRSSSYLQLNGESGVSSYKVFTNISNNHDWFTALQKVGVGINWAPILRQANKTLAKGRKEIKRIKDEKLTAKYNNSFAHQWVEKNPYTNVQLSCISLKDYLKQGYFNNIPLSIEYKGHKSFLELENNRYVLRFGYSLDIKKRYMSDVEKAIDKAIKLIDESIREKETKKALEQKKKSAEQKTLEEYAEETGLEIVMESATRSYQKSRYQREYYQVTEYRAVIKNKKILISKHNDLYTFAGISELTVEQVKQIANILNK